MNAAALIWLLEILLLLPGPEGLPLRWRWTRMQPTDPSGGCPPLFHGLEALTSPTPDWLSGEWARCPAAAEAGAAFPYWRRVFLRGCPER